MGEAWSFTTLEWSPQEGGDETSVGAVRSLQIGDQMLFEKLVALDDEEHIM